MIKGTRGIVTGGGSGIGLATVRRLLTDGARVVAVDINQDALASLKTEFDSPNLVTAALDITEADAARNLIEEHVGAGDRLTFLVNAAGISQSVAPLHEISRLEFERVHAVNLLGSFLMYQAVVRHMIGSKVAGSIVNIASTAGIRPVAATSAYAASKHGVIGMTTSAALEVGQHGIRVNAICPGVTDTPLLRSKGHGPAADLTKRIPLRRIGSPEDVANGIIWLLSDEASYVTGAVLSIDGGLALT